MRGSRPVLGFSLVEALVTVAVIGIIAAVAIPNVVVWMIGAQATTNKRNAQNIASIASAARAAGWSPSGNKESDLAALIEGSNPVMGLSVPGTSFSAPMSPDAANAASTYLTDGLFYVNGGEQTQTNLN